MGSNRGNHPKHGPGYTCFKDAKGKKTGKAKKAKQIAEGKKKWKKWAAQQRA